MYTDNAILADIATDILSWKNEYNIHITADVIANINVQTVKLLVFLDRLISITIGTNLNIPAIVAAIPNNTTISALLFAVIPNKRGNGEYSKYVSKIVI